MRCAKPSSAKWVGFDSVEIKKGHFYWARAVTSAVVLEQLPMSELWASSPVLCEGIQQCAIVLGRIRGKITTGSANGRCVVHIPKPPMERTWLS